MKTRGLSPKTVFYQTNGTGRDTYISDNNGGAVKQTHFRMSRVSSKSGLIRLVCALESDEGSEAAFGSQSSQIPAKRHW